MKKFGFGLMRLPTVGDSYTEVDLNKFQEMADAFIAAGGTYFDTAYPYHGGFSEQAFREVVVKRYPRDAFTVTDKMPVYLVNAELEVLDKATRIIRSGIAIACTACRYCVSESKCPKDIMIPDYFAMYNDKKRYNTMTAGIYYSNLAMLHGKASECIECGLCEKHCPQHLPIRKHLKEVAAAFEK